MKFKEFMKWCNDRACDGRWGLNEAYLCLATISDVRARPFWQRKKYWEKVRSEVEEIVYKTNELISLKESEEIE